MDIADIFEEECEVLIGTDLKVSIDENLDNNFVFSIVRYGEIEDCVSLSVENTKKLVEVLSKKLKELED